MKRYLFATLLLTVFLYLWSGITQMLPWGVPSTQKITTRSASMPNDPDDLIRLQANELTTANFDPTFNNKISTYSTDQTFSWIVTHPVRTDYTGYFIGELITQFSVAVLLTLLLALTKNYATQKRMMLIALVGLLGWAATYGQLLNWWGMPALYAVGVGVNLIAGWLATSFLVSRFILRS